MKSAGFSLLEVLFTAAILSIGLLGTAAMLSVSIQGNSFGRQQSVATQLVHQRMEEYRNLDYNGIISATYGSKDQTATAGPCATNQSTDTEDYGAIASYSLYKRISKVCIADAPEKNQILRATVRVEWKTKIASPSTSTHTVEMMALFSK